MASEYFSKPTPERNLALIVQKIPLWISKEVLASYSPVFQKMFYGSFKEANSDQMEMPGKVLFEFQQFLECLVPCPIRQSVTEGNLQLMMKYADEYEIDDLKHRCELVLREIMAKMETSKRDEFFEYFTLSIIYRYKNVAKQYLPTAASYPIEIINKNRSLFSMPILLALFEAKLNRCLAEKHDLGTKPKWLGESGCPAGCYDKKFNHYQCKKCHQIVCPKRRETECKVYHQSNCRYKHGSAVPDCFCGYVYDENVLNSL